mmetsp:Transcript_29326/g.84276  ORF Transcript_29326/g.84276 Transcript_29326/m.84276 type:complete len:516 (-) Transcript_29326:388-1935(-)
MTIDHVPIVLKAAEAVPHRMRILDHDQRETARGSLVQSGVLLKLHMARVHRHEHVCVVVDRLNRVRRPCGLQSRVLVLHYTRLVPAFQPHERAVMVDPVPRLVRERPKENARVVLVALNEARHPRHVGLAPKRVVPQGLVPLEAAPMALDVRLAHDVQAVLVAQLVPKGVVGVVRAPDGVEVVGFHHPDVLQHRAPADDVPGVRVMLMAVDAADGERAAVQQEPALPDLDRPETHGDSQRLIHIRALGRRALQAQHQGVQVRLLGAPEADVWAQLLALCDGDIAGPRGDGQRERADHPRVLARGGGRAPEREEASRLRLRLRRLPTPGVELATQCQPRRQRPRGQGDFGLDLEEPVGPRPHLDVADVLHRPGECEDVAGDARQPPHVLILEVGAGGPTPHLHRERVRSPADVGRHLKFGRHLAVGAEAQLGTVHPHATSTSGSANVQEDLQALVDPRRRDIELAPVGAGGVVGRVLAAVLHKGRFGEKAVDDVRVDGEAVPVQLPVPRHRHGAPS